MIELVWLGWHNFSSSSLLLYRVAHLHPTYNEITADLILFVAFMSIYASSSKNQSVHIGIHLKAIATEMRLATLIDPKIYGLTHG